MQHETLHMWAENIPALLKTDNFEEWCDAVEFWAQRRPNLL